MKTVSTKQMSLDRKTKRYVAFSSDLHLEVGYFPETILVTNGYGTVPYYKKHSVSNGSEMVAMMYETATGTQLKIYND